MHNIGQPETSSWLPKFMQPAPAQPKFGGGTNVTELATTSPAAKKGKPKKIDPLSMARLHERRGQYEQAVKIYERELPTNAKKVLIHHRLAVIAAREGQWDKSREHFTEACRLEPRNSEVLGDLGYALYLQHQLPDAEQCLLAAVEANPQNKAAQNNLGIVLGVQGKYEQSLAAFRRAVPDAEAHANLGYVHMQLGDADKAMDELNQALSLDKGLKTAAVALVQMNDLKKRLTPKDLDQMTIASKDAKSAPGKSPSQATEPGLELVEQPGAPANPSQVVAAKPVSEPAAPQVPPAFAAYQTQPVPAPTAPTPAAPAPVQSQPVRSQPDEQVVAMPSMSQRLVSGYQTKELTPRETQMAIAPAAAPAPADSRIKEIPERLPSPTSFVSLSGLGTTEPATPTSKPVPVQQTPAAAPPALPRASIAQTSKPDGTRQIATLADPADTVVQASAQVNTAPPLLQFPGGEVGTSVPAQRGGETQSIPVFKPSERIQSVRSQDRSYTTSRPLTATTSPQGNPSSVQPVTADSANNDLASAVKSAQAAGAKTSVVQPTTGASPSMVPQVAMPRPEDMLPAHSQLNQLPTHQLHPTASPTWTAPSTPTPASNGTSSAVKGPLPRVKVMPN